MQNINNVFTETGRISALHFSNLFVAETDEKKKADLIADTLVTLQERIEQKQQSSDIATKNDVQLVRTDVQILREEVKKEIVESKLSIIKWVAGLMVAQTALFVSLSKIL